MWKFYGRLKVWKIENGKWKIESLFKVGSLRFKVQGSKIQGLGLRVCSCSIVSIAVNGNNYHYPRPQRGKLFIEKFS